MSQASKPKVVAITGASAGVGRAVVQAYAARGAHIGLMARGTAGLDGARRDVETAGGKAVVCKVDVSKFAEVDQAASVIEDELGPIDVWVNCAMASVFSRFMEMTPDEFQRVTDVTYHGYVWGTMAALKRMIPRDQGVIVQVGSALAYRGIPAQSAYCGAKHAIQGFTESVRTELMHDKINIHLTEVHLPAVNTPQFRWVKSRLPRKAQPVPPIYQPELIAEAIMFAAERRRRELFVAWPAWKAIVGNKFFPNLGDQQLAGSGIESQMIDEPADPNRPHNLWEPVDETRDHGAHGVFDNRARNDSLQLRVTMNRKWLALAGAFGIAAGAALIGARDT